MEAASSRKKVSEAAGRLFRVLHVTARTEEARKIQLAASAEPDVSFQWEVAERLDLVPERATAGQADLILLDLSSLDKKDSEALTVIRSCAPNALVIALGDVAPVTVAAWRAQGIDYLPRNLLDSVGLPRLLHQAAQRKQLQDKLKETQEELRTVVQASPFPIFSLDLEGNVRGWNPAAEQILGWKEEDVMGKPLPPVLPDHRVRFETGQQILRQGKSFSGREFLYRTKSGAAVCLNIFVSPLQDALGNFRGSLAVIEDATSGKLAEQALVSARQQAAIAGLSQKALAGASLPALFAEAVELVAHSLDLGYCEIFEILSGGESMLLRAAAGWGKQHEENLCMPIEEDSYARHTLCSQDPVIVRNFEEETRFRLPAALAQMGVKSSLCAVIQGQNQPYALMGAHSRTQRVFTDDEVSFFQLVRNVLAQAVQRQQAEKRLRESEAQFRTLAESASAGISVYQDNRFRYVNPATVALTGYSREELLEMDFADLVHPDFRAVVQERSQLRLQGHPVPSGYEIKFITKSGEERWAHLTAAACEFEGQPAGMGMAVDVTERKRLEETLLQAHKMEAVGRLAGGVAHDFNNVLGVITGATELLLEHVAEGHPAREFAEDILVAGNRATAVIGKLLDFSRKEAVQPKVLDLNAVLADVVKMIGRLIGEHIEIHMTTDPSLGRIRMGEGEMERIIINLALNARDAMPAGGKLFLETADVRIDDRFSGLRPKVPSGHYARLLVRDTGSGMDRQARTRLFEPFFTTKAQGTGLGLSIVYGILRQHGGYIEVSSEPGQGAAFEIYMPRVEEMAEPETPEKPVAIGQGGETILLVEDEATLRKLSRAFLEAEGYRVLDFGDGSEAVQFAGQHAGPIDLLVTDVVMPGLTGPVLAERLGELRPELRLLYVSGYSGDTLSRRGMSVPATAVLSKPYTRKELLRKVRETLAPARPADPRSAGPRSAGPRSAGQ